MPVHVYIYFVHIDYAPHADMHTRDVAIEILYGQLEPTELGSSSQELIKLKEEQSTTG